MKYEPGTAIQAPYKGEPKELVVISARLLHESHYYSEHLQEALESGRIDPREATMLTDSNGRCYAGSWPKLENLTEIRMTAPINVMYNSPSLEGLRASWNSYWQGEAQAKAVKGRPTDENHHPEETSEMIKAIREKEAELQDLEAQLAEAQRDAEAAKGPLRKAEQKVAETNKRITNAKEALQALRQTEEDGAND